MKSSHLVKALLLAFIVLAVAVPARIAVHSLLPDGLLIAIDVLVIVTAPVIVSLYIFPLLLRPGAKSGESSDRPNRKWRA